MKSNQLYTNQLYTTKIIINDLINNQSQNEVDEIFNKFNCKYEIQDLIKRIDLSKNAFYKLNKTKKI